MKKFVCFMMAVLLMLSSSVAIAEEFTLHSGVTFGMSEEEVINLEKSAGFTIEEDTKPSSESSASKIVKIKGKIAGIENGSIIYAFSSDDQTYAATYNFSAAERDKIEEYYNSIENILIEKYGEPVDGWLPVVYRLDFEPLNFLFNVTGKLSEDELPPSSTWTIETEEGETIVIAHYYMYIAFTSTLKLPMHVVGYQIYNTEELNNAASAVVSDTISDIEQSYDDL